MQTTRLLPMLVCRLQNKLKVVKVGCTHFSPSCSSFLRSLPRFVYSGFQECMWVRDRVCRSQFHLNSVMVLIFHLGIALHTTTPAPTPVIFIFLRWCVCV